MKIDTIVYIFLTVVFFIILIIFSKYNKLIRYQNRVKKSKANIDIYLNKRFDLIPNIVECVKGYSKHEKDTLEDITKLRADYKGHDNITVKEGEMMNNKLNKFLAVVEAYPELKANEEFLNLQKELRNIEDELESARRRYNDDVTLYNTLVETIPSNIVAGLFNFNKADLFKIEDVNKENIKIELNN